MTEKLIFEYSKEGRRGYRFPVCDVPVKPYSDLVESAYLRKDAAELPQVSEIDVVRHYSRISRLNFSVDANFYPLGSCTMKYNPKVNERVAANEGFAQLHPMAPQETAQGILEALYDLEKLLCELCGMDAFTLQPAAGAHGELVGMMIARAYFTKKGQSDRKIVLIPDSGHGTNPASAALHGFEVKTLVSGSDGRIDINALKGALNQEVAAIMITNPNTLGFFEKDILEIAQLIHDNGSLFYCDGANLNAVVGLAKPGDMGVDILHTNMHKTFSTPHGGGGPGAGPVGVKKELAEFLPVPRICYDDKTGKYYLQYNLENTIGRVMAYFGNVGVLLKAYAYILTLGKAGLRQVALDAILNANYLRARLCSDFDLPYSGTCMHEFVISAEKQAQKGTSALDIAKALIDRGVHPPTIYFPLIVKEALMIEPTETETKETLDEFADEMLKLSELIKKTPEVFHNYPQNTPVGRLDEVTAARKPVLKWY